MYSCIRVRVQLTQTFIRGLHIFLFHFRLTVSPLIIDNIRGGNSVRKMIIVHGRG